jgi:hypothetical protein
LGEEIKSTIYAMRFRIDKGMLADRIRDAKPLYERINSVVFKVFEGMRPANEGTLNRAGRPEMEN